MEQFRSGEVAYLLNNGVTDGSQTWYQTCGEGLPSYSGKTVYSGYLSCGADAAKVYTNDSTISAEYVHDYSEGPQFIWAEDHTCSAVFTCGRDAAHTETITCSITSFSDEDKTVYTASVTKYGTTYTDDNTVPIIRINVDITWGDMDFTYTDDGGWAPSQEGGNLVTVENSGNTAVTVSVDFTKTGAYGLTGSVQLTDDAEEGETEQETEDGTEQESSPAPQSAAGAENEAGLESAVLKVKERKTFELVISGKPEDVLEQAEFGYIRVTITAA